MLLANKRLGWRICYRCDYKEDALLSLVSTNAVLGLVEEQNKTTLTTSGWGSPSRWKKLARKRRVNALRLRPLRAHCKPLNDPEPSTPSRPEQPWPLERSKRGKFPKTRGSKATSSIGALLLFLPRAATSNRKFGTRPERRDRILSTLSRPSLGMSCRCKITGSICRVRCG